MNDNGGSGNGLFAALAAFQTDLPRVGKDNTARVKSDKANYTYQYADLADVSAAVLPALGRQGLSWTTLPTVLDDGKFVLRYELLHASGESLSGTYPLPAANSQPQVLGSALTYARRYCLCAVTGVSPDDDDDAAAAQAERSRTARDVPAGLDFEDRAETAVKNNNRGELVKIWREAKRLRPDDADLLARLETLGKGLPAVDSPKTSVEPENTVAQAAPAEPAPEPGDTDFDWSAAIAEAVNNGDLRGLEDLWESAKHSEPGNTALAQQIRAAVAQVKASEAEAIAYEPKKPRDALRKQLFGILAEAGIKDTDPGGRERRLLICSRLLTIMPVITSTAQLSDIQLGQIINALLQYRSEGTLESTLANWTVKSKPEGVTT